MRAVFAFVAVTVCFACTANASPDDGAAAAGIHSTLQIITSVETVERATTGANHSLPGWTSVLPPLIAIVLALALRHVLLALIVGVWLGAFLISGLAPLTSFARLLDTHLVGAVADRGHASILLFSLLLGLGSQPSDDASLPGASPRSRQCHLGERDNVDDSRLYVVGPLLRKRDSWCFPGHNGLQVIGWEVGGRQGEHAVVPVVTRRTVYNGIARLCPGTRWPPPSNLVQTRKF